MRILLALLLFTATASAQNSAVVFKNKCPDIIAEAPDWKCLNKSQACQRGETIAQIEAAIAKTKTKRKLKVISIDPKRPDKDTWLFGAWKRGKAIQYACMPGCPDARKELEKVLRRLKRVK